VPSVSDVSACSIEDTFRIKEAVQVVLKKDPDELEFSSRPGNDDVVTVAKSIPEPDFPMNSTLKEELEEDSQISQVIDDVLHDLNDPESSLTNIMSFENFETEDLDALAEIEEGTFDNIPTTSTAVPVVLEQRSKSPEFEYLGSADLEAEESKRISSTTSTRVEYSESFDQEAVEAKRNSSITSNGEKKEVPVPSSPESQEVYIYLCPFDKCSFTTDFQGVKSGSGAMHVINVHKMEPFMFKMKGLRWKKVSIEEQMEQMFASA